ncbi:hypothetical protein BGZ50_003644 [Haplosporangium sp. Z 11]|nr:hypothetical protein BGZ50_003644 [Haplosporangium sp. Z 11]
MSTPIVNSTLTHGADASPSASSVKRTRPDHLVLRPMTADDKEEFAALFSKVFQREPLGQYHGVAPEEGRIIADDATKDPVSFVVEDTTLERPHRLVAFRANRIITKATLAAKQKKVQEEGSIDGVQAILHRMDELWLSNSMVFKMNPEAKVMKFIALGVDEGYEGLGLAKELLDASMEKAKEYKCDAIVVVATAFATQHLFKNRLQFEEMGKVRFTDFVWKKTKTQGGEEERPFAELLKPEFSIVFEKKL